MSDEADAGGTGRAERLFARLGVAAAGLLALLLVLLVDVALTSSTRPVLERTNEFDISLVTRDGRDLGGVPGALQLQLSPGTFFENRPGPDGFEGTINSRGLRGPEIETAPGLPRVIVIGGSSAYGLGVTSEETLPWFLGQRLPDAEVLNAGTAGYLSMQEAAQVYFDLLELEPDVIVAFDGWNDLYDPYWWAMFGTGDPRHPGINTNFAFLENRLVEYRRIQTQPALALQRALGSFLRSSTLLSPLFRASRELAPSAEPGLDDAEVERIAAAYVANMGRIRDLLRARGGELLVVIQPELGQLLAAADLEDVQRRYGDMIPGDRYWFAFPDLYRHFRDAATRGLLEQRIPMLDVSARWSGREKPADFFLDAVHLSEAGNQALAEVLLPEVRRRLRPEAEAP